MTYAQYEKRGAEFRNAPEGAVMRYRAFVFDAENPVRSFLGTVLKRRGYEVYCYAEAFECLKCRGGRCADLVITDVVLSRGSGVEFLKAQQAADCKNDNFALMASSWSREDLEAARALGCQIFSKPFSLADLESWLDEVEASIPADRVLTDFYLDSADIPCDGDV